MFLGGRERERVLGTSGLNLRSERKKKIIIALKPWMRAIYPYSVYGLIEKSIPDGSVPLVKRLLFLAKL